MSYGAEEEFDSLIGEGKHRSEYVCCGRKSSNPQIRNLQLAWWRNMGILGVFIVAIIIAATQGATSWGLAKSGPIMEKTGNATIGMRRDTQRIIKGATKWWLETMVKDYPANQNQLWLARFDSISTSVEQILGVVSVSAKANALNIEGVVGAGIKSLDLTVLLSV